MNRSDLIHEMACNFLSIAGSQTFMDLKNQDKDQLWFTDFVAAYNGADNFARFDKANIKSISNLSVVDGIEEAAKFYLEHEKTQNLIRFILESFQRKFPSSNPWAIYEHLKDQGLDYNSGGYVSETPIFLLIHDLIHSVLQDNFIDQLRSQNDAEPNLADEIFEDLASTMSNFQPKQYGRINFAPFLVRYLERTFNSYMKDMPANEKTLTEAINNTFHQAKAELRGKIDNIAMSDEYLERYENTKPLSGKIKQLIDGMLSKYKRHMLENIETAINNYRYYGSLFPAFALDDIHDDYRDLLQKSDVIDPVEASNLRAWMQGCLSKMGEVYAFFQNLTDDYYDDELYDSINEYNDIEEDGSSDKENKD